MRVNAPRHSPLLPALVLALITASQAFVQADAQTSHASTHPTITHLAGQAYLKTSPSPQVPPIPLASNHRLSPSSPLVGGSGNHLLLTTEKSLLEIALPRGALIRFGQNTAVETSPRKIRLLQGSFLRHAEEEILFALSGKRSHAGVRLQKGSLMAQATSNGGLKIILLSGQAQIGTHADGAKTLRPGQLLFIKGAPAKFGDLYDLDLPLLLTTSRLVNAFPRPLPRQHHLKTSALIQQLNLKRSYQALIGDTPDDRTIQIWANRPDRNASPP